MALSKTNPPSKPTLVCVGKVGAIAETKKSQSGKYLHNCIDLHAEGAGMNQKTWLLWHPDWFGGAFNVNELESDDPMRMTYGNNIWAAETPAAERSTFKPLVSTLEAVMGPELFKEYSEGAGFDEFAGLSAEQMAEKFEAVLKECIGREVGYVLTQKQEKVGGEWINTPYYNVTGLFHLTDENLDYFVKRAKKANKKRPLELRFDRDVPFGQGAASSF